MKKLCEIMVIIYIILFIPVSILSTMFESVSLLGMDGVNSVVASVVRFLMNFMPVIVFASAGFGYAMNKTEKYNISLYILLVPIIAFVVVWIGVMVA